MLVLQALAVSLLIATDRDVARGVADRILAETTFRLKDPATGATYADAPQLADPPRLVIASRFNQWFYGTLLVTEGLDRLGQVCDVAAYREFGPRELEFVARVAPWFREQWRRSGKRPDGANELGHFLNISSLWATGLATTFVERALATGDPRYADYLTRFKQMLDKRPRSADGLLLEGGAVRTDDIYLTGSALLRVGLGERDRQRIDDAINHVLGAHRLLFVASDALYRQAWDVRAGKFIGEYWGRGFGWQALAEVDLLAHLPASHPRWPEVLAAYHAAMAGLRRWQAPDGGWRQLMDVPEAWVETSCTGMGCYALARGVNEGWLDATYADDARRAWTALKTKVTPPGMLVDVCPGTGPGSRAWYLGRPRAKDDVHGYGPFLLAAAEMLRMDQR